MSLGHRIFSGAFAPLAATGGAVAPLADENSHNALSNDVPAYHCQSPVEYPAPLQELADIGKTNEELGDTNEQNEKSQRDENSDKGQDYYSGYGY